MSGTLYGLGIGPGDPDLMTLKARAILAEAPVIAYPAPEGGTSLVRAIADPHVPAGRIEIAIVTPMTADRFPAREVYDRAAGEISRHLDAGRDVAVLCEGDPFLYGSFMYVYERVARDYRSVVVPGVSSLTATAAAAGRPLAARNDVLMIVPAPLPEAVLADRLAVADAAAIMKVGRHLPKVRRVLARLGLLDDAAYIERATMADERMARLADLPEDLSAPYFSMILVNRPAGAKASTVVEGAARTLPEGAAIVRLTSRADGLARRLRDLLPGSRVHAFAGRGGDADVTFADTGRHLGALFQAGTPIVGLCAAGILIRALAPHLSDKHAEPPVVAVAEDGSSAVPLLGGHHGANRLARAIAGACGGAAAITTAGELRLGVGLDDPPPGWRVANPAAVKTVAAALLAGQGAGLRVEAGNARWLTAAGIGADDGATAGIRVTDREAEGGDGALVLHPPVLAVGIGCERDAPPDEVMALVTRTLDDNGLAAGAVACVASIDVKADEPAVHRVAAELGVPARFVDAATLEAETPRLATPSDAVFRAVGCHGVAEAAALVAAGAGGTLVVTKTKSARATCAIARATDDIDPTTVGRPRGHLAIVGIGPGDAGWRTADATLALTQAEDVVGLPLYLDLIADLIAGKRRHATPLSEETARARRALELAAEGRRVALVSSGDAGLYGLASLVFESLDLEDRADWNRVEVTVYPGVSAFQAASARLGAITGHDVCLISLSDLLTPWPAIERRLAAAADGDFVVALYNPVSARRRSHLPRARDVLLGARPPDTPVILARQLTRPGERLEIIRLAELEADHADMLTLVVVGSSASRVVWRGARTFVYTPRGYAGKGAVGDDRPIETEASS